MAAIAFDPLGYTHELEASGVPRAQAEVHAKAMTATFLHNFEALVTRDYLDTRFTEFETRVSANMDSRFSKVDRQFSEFRLETQEEFNGLRGEMHKAFHGQRGEIQGEISGLDQKITGLREDMLHEIHRIDQQMSEIRSTLKLQSWISAVLMAGVFIPLLQKLAA
jgi:hypothetical protein